MQSGPNSSEKWPHSIWSRCLQGSTIHNLHSMYVCGPNVSVVPLTIEMDLPEPRHFALSSSRTAGLQERLHERLHVRLEERLGMVWGGPSLELCTASYRLSIDPSWSHVHRQTHSYQTVEIWQQAWFMNGFYLLCAIKIKMKYTVCINQAGYTFNMLHTSHSCIYRFK